MRWYRRKLHCLFILSSASATSPNAFTSGTWKVMTGWFYPRQTAQVNIGAGCQKEGTHKKIIIPRIYSRRPTVLEPGLFGNFLWKGGKDFLNRRTTRCSTGVSSTMIQSDLCWMFEKQGWQRHNEDGANGVDADEADQEGHESSIFTIAFSPNGKLLVTGGQDGFCRLVFVVPARRLIKESFHYCRLWQADDNWSCSQKWELARCWQPLIRFVVWKFHFDPQVDGG